MSDDNIRKQAKAIVDASPELKRAKDVSNGFSGKGFGSTHGGKGSSTRPGDEQQYKDNFDKIDWSKGKDKPKFKVKVNGVYVNDVDEGEIDKS
tara:strand:- start:59 stop:337 length:279 start_codon:yes stop_codon:yes gene_type:complete